MAQLIQGWRELWHKSVTEERLSEMVERRMASLDNPGVCLSCGIEVDGVEPDAANYDCEACGDPAVFGADEALMMLAAGV